MASDDQGTRARRVTWLVGGIGLVGCGVLSILQRSFVGPGMQLLLAGATAVVLAVSICIFTFGLSRVASVVARDPLGEIALVLLAAWQVASFAIERFLPAPSSMDSWGIYSYAAMLVSATIALVAVVQIGRSPTVPFPWRWAPAWALFGQAAAWALAQVAYLAVNSSSAALADFTAVLGLLVSLVPTLGLGIVSIALAMRERPGTVQVFRST